VLTDRPSANAVTERTWQMEREDPAAVHQRALEVRREADAVSERVQRMIEAQERRATEADLERMRLARFQRPADASWSDGDGDGSAIIVAPLALRPARLRRTTPFSVLPAPRQAMRSSSAMQRVSGSASRESR
jgi:hypothetical protein